MAGPGPGSGGPIYFAWVDSTATTFSTGTHCVYDEPVWSLNLTHEEGQIPTCEVEITNPCIGTPYVGLLAASRKQWAWISVWDYESSTVKPLIFGRIVGIPSDLSQKYINVLFIARADDYISRKQDVADTLRVAPYYDPIFLDDKSRFDPDAIIEAYPARWHIDRTTLAWTISDILEGEDGTVSIGQDKILSDISFNVKEEPLRAVRAQSSVTWKQSFRNVNIPILIGSRAATLTGGTLVSSWPKLGDDLSGGWRIAAGTKAVDWGGTEHVSASQESGSFQDENPTHREGDVISANWSSTRPPAGYIYGGQSSATYANFGSGGGDVGKGYGDGILSGANQGAGGQESTTSSYSSSWNVVVPWTIAASLFIESTGDPNTITETLTFTVTSNVQPVLTDSGSLADTYVKDFPSIDVGEPYIDVRAWSSLKAAGGSVSVGQVMAPNIPIGPGGLSYQTAIVAGTMGSSAPLFSDEAGTTTTDGTVTWASLGTTSPSIGTWASGAYVRKGAMICSENSGGYFFVCTVDGYSGTDEPSFDTTVGNTTTDGGVTWKSLGSGSPSLIVPIGSLPGNIEQPDFFPTSRGYQAIEYMLAWCCALIKDRSRAVEIGCEIPFSTALDLTLRKSATITHKYLPGGTATGKIVSYSISADGDGGRSANIKIACACGKGGTVSTSAGEDDYSDALAHEAQTQSGVLTDVNSEISYEPPLPDPNYSGLKPPIDFGKVVLQATWVGSLGAQLSALFGSVGTIQNVARQFGSNGAARMAALQDAGAEASRNVPPVYFELHLRPIAGNEVTTPYSINVEPLIIPTQIDLEAEPI